MSDETVAQAIGRLADEFKRFNDRVEKIAAQPRPSMPGGKEIQKVIDSVGPFVKPFLNGMGELTPKP